MIFAVRVLQNTLKTHAISLGWTLIESPATRKFARHGATRLATLKSNRRAQRNWPPRKINSPPSVILWR